MSEIQPPSVHYQTIARAIRYIRTHAGVQPTLADVAAAVGLSEHHLQRVFSEWAGISPKRFLQYLTKEHARQCLRASADVLRTSLHVGLSGPGRLHDLMVTCEAMTPGEVQTGGLGVEIGTGIARTPFGHCLLGWTTRGLCFLQFFDCEARQSHVPADDATESDVQPVLAQLQSQWPAAHVVRDDAQGQRSADLIFSRTARPGTLHLLLRGTNFQLKVWEALLRLQPGQLLSYGQLAQRAGSPKAARAVGTAMAANTIGYLIPCHRVIRETGDSGQYRWSPERKAAMLAWEQATA